MSNPIRKVIAGMNSQKVLTKVVPSTELPIAIWAYQYHPPVVDSDVTTETGAGGSARISF
jgi:hypothetical protein